MVEDKKELRETLQGAQNELIRAKGELSRKQAELETIYRTIKIIHSTLDINEIARIIKDVLNKVLKFDAYTLMVYDNVAKDFVFQTGKGFSKGTQEEILSRARESKGDWLEDFGSLGKVSPISKDKYSFKCIPLRAHDRLVGGFCTLTETASDLSKENIELITVVATQMAIAVENSILYEMTKKLAITDELTSLYNYRYFRNRLAGELSRAKRYNRPLSLIMLDLDDFKNYNDTYGHLQGDKALRETAKIMVRNCRESDMVARYGGEEFVIILPETDKQGALSVAEKVRQAAEVHHFPGKQKRNQHITLSLGVVQNSEKISSPKSLVKMADAALYKSKREGKNRVSVADST